MPLIFSDHLDNGVAVGVWSYEEDTTFFENNLELYYEEVNELTDLTERKQLEWLGARYLLHKLMGKNYRLATVKDNFGKPYLIGTDKYISLSHSGKYTAAIVSSKNTGIDVQVIVPKIEKIKNRFLSLRELEHYEESHDINTLLVYWGAKESLFKAYGKGGVDFKKELYVAPFILEDKCCKGYVYKDNTEFAYDIRFFYNEDYVLVYIINGN
jgi:4'-phosphopantetheinyl transferase